MDNPIETQRHRHEEIERTEQAIVQQYLAETSTAKHKLNRDHAVRRYIDRIHALSQELQEAYDDRDGSLAQAVKRIEGPSEFDEFYRQLEDVLAYHKQYPNEIVEPMEVMFTREAEEAERQDAAEETVADRIFSGEEGVGRYLDLHEQHEQYANLKDVPKLDYLAYLGELDNFAAIPRASKNQAYRDYLASLQTYLEDYFTRALPLFDVAGCRSAAATDFDTRWTEHRVRGWETSEADQLQELFPLYCLACRKQYSKQTVYDAHLKSRKHQKAAKALEQTGQRADDPAAVRQAQRATLAELDAKDRAVAWQEYLIAKYLEALGEKREDTRANVERKQALTEEERNAEVQEEDVDVDQYESDDNEPIYNPLKLPLGWDGKPIPYWLYKLHGLSHNYDCEICGDYTYRGRKDFDRHFTEWRHVHGLRCLGIPPGDRAFIGITRIEDAVRLWDKMKAGRKSEKNQTEHIEEFEDSEGNVFSKKTYEDLKRQGLI